MATGEIWEGTAVITVFIDQNINDPANPATINVDLSKVSVTWNGKVPPLNDTKTLNFTLPSGYTAAYIYNYDLHGHNPSAGINGVPPQLVSTINSTDPSEKALQSSVPTNWFGGTDWWYGPPPDKDHPLYTVGSTSNPPATISYKFINTDEISQGTWNIYILIGLASNAGGGGGGGGGISWSTIAAIVIVILVLIIIIYFAVSYFERPSSQATHYHPDHGYHSHPSRQAAMQSAM